MTRVLTVLSAQWGNEQRSSAVIFTAEAGAVAISEVDTPEEWKVFETWTLSNAVSPLTMPLPPRKSELDLLEERVAALEAKLVI
jgi:hypothetical protein